MIMSSKIINNTTNIITNSPTVGTHNISEYNALRKEGGGGSGGSGRPRPPPSTPSRLLVLSSPLARVRSASQLKHSMSQARVYGKPASSIKSKDHPLHGLKFPGKPPSATDDISQAEARVWLPPNTYLWRNNNEGKWLFNQPSIKRRGRAAWSAHGGSSLKALRACLREAWENYLEVFRLPNSHCPIGGLLA